MLTILILHVLVGAIIGAVFDATILDALFLHSDKKGTIIGFLLGLTIGLITGTIHLIGIKLKIFNKQRKCPECGSRNTELYLWKPGIAMSGYKSVCRDCGHVEIVVK
jgi:hypothetical protein